MNFPDEIFKNIMSFIPQTPYPKIELGKTYYLSRDYDLYNKQYYQLLQYVENNDDVYSRSTSGKWGTVKSVTLFKKKTS